MQFSHTTWPVSENRDEARQQHRDLCDIACNLIGKPHEYSDGQRTHYGLIVHTYVRVE